MLEARIRTQEWTSVSYRNCKMFCSRPRTRVSPFTGTAAPFLCGSSLLLCCSIAAECCLGKHHRALWGEEDAGLAGSQALNQESRG